MQAHDLLIDFEHQLKGPTTQQSNKKHYDKKFGLSMPGFLSDFQGFYAEIMVSEERQSTRPGFSRIWRVFA